MNKFTYTFFGTLFMTSLPLASSLAGVDYNQYHDQIRSEQAAKSPASEAGKRFEHQSKYQRDQGQEMPDNTLPTKDRDLNRPTSRSGQTK